MNNLIHSTYHYLFSRLPEDKKSDENYIMNLAEEIRTPYINQFELTDFQASFNEVKNKYPDVNPIKIWGNEKTETYLSQFWVNDVLVTLINFDFPDAEKMNFSFPDSDLGTTTAHLISAQLSSEEQRKIKEKFFPKEQEPKRYTLFDWGGIRFSDEVGKYILLAHNTDNASRFLSIDFPLLELIRRKFIYEKQVFEKLKEQYKNYQQQIEQNLELISGKLGSKTKEISSIENALTQLEGQTVKLCEVIYRNRDLLNTFDINILNFKEHLSELPIDENENQLFPFFVKKLFVPLKRQVEVELLYYKNEFDALDKKIQFIHLKIELLRQNVESERNELERFASEILSAIGVAIGVGQILIASPLPLYLKLMWMAISGMAVFITVHLVMNKKLKEEKDTNKQIITNSNRNLIEGK